MMELWHNFHFIRPWFLLLSLIPLALYFTYFRSHVSLSSWQKVIDKPLLNFLLIKGSSKQRKFYIISSLIGLLTAIFALSGPSWEKREIPQLQKQNPVFVLLNLSSDMQETDLKPDRLQRAKYKIQDFLSLLKSSQSAMMVYSSEPFVIAPFTQDTNLLQNLLKQIDLDIMPVNGDRLDRAIDLAVERFKMSGYSQGSIVIFAPDSGQKFDLAVSAAENAAKQNINVNIIGVSAQTNEKLAMIAKAGKGSYWTMQNDDAKIAALAQKINDINAPIAESANLNLQDVDGGWYFVILPLLCALMLFRKGLLVIIFAVILASPARAGFFTNADQDGLSAFQKGEFARSAELFKDKNWQAASYYRLGDYKTAYQLYAQDNSTEGLYNQGNALAKSGAIKEAIAKYEEVLKISPNHQDAKFNLEYLKKQQQQQNQQNPQDNQNQDKQNQSEQNNQSSSGSDDNSDDNQNNQSSGSQENQNNDSSANQNQQSSASQNTSSSNNQSSEQSSPQENDSDKQSEGQQPLDSESDNTSDEKSSKSPNQRQLDTSQTADKGKIEPSAQSAKLAEDGEDYDEKLQAKAQQYREIPEDVGGLLRAFIAQEYSQNRYNEN